MIIIILIAVILVAIVIWLVWAGSLPTGSPAPYQYVPPVPKVDPEVERMKEKIKKSPLFRR